MDGILELAKMLNHRNNLSPRAMMSGLVTKLNIEKTGKPKWPTIEITLGLDQMDLAPVEVFDRKLFNLILETKSNLIRAESERLSVKINVDELKTRIKNLNNLINNDQDSLKTIIEDKNSGILKELDDFYKENKNTNENEFKKYQDTVEDEQKKLEEFETEAIKYNNHLLAYINKNVDFEKKQNDAVNNAVSKPGVQGTPSTPSTAPNVPTTPSQPGQTNTLNSTIDQEFQTEKKNCEDSSEKTEQAKTDFDDNRKETLSAIKKFTEKLHNIINHKIEIISLIIKLKERILNLECQCLCEDIEERDPPEDSSKTACDQLKKMPDISQEEITIECAENEGEPEISNPDELNKKIGKVNEDTSKVINSIQTCAEKCNVTRISLKQSIKKKLSKIKEHLDKSLTILQEPMAESLKDEKNIKKAKTEIENIKKGLENFSFNKLIDNEHLGGCLEKLKKLDISPAKEMIDKVKHKMEDFLIRKYPFLPQTVNKADEPSKFSLVLTAKDLIFSAHLLNGYRRNFRIENRKLSGREVSPSSNIHIDKTKGSSISIDTMANISSLGASTSKEQCNRESYSHHSDIKHKTNPLHMGRSSNHCHSLSSFALEKGSFSATGTIRFTDSLYEGDEVLVVSGIKMNKFFVVEKIVTLPEE